MDEQWARLAAMYGISVEEVKSHGIDPDWWDSLEKAKRRAEWQRTKRHETKEASQVKECPVEKQNQTIIAAVIIAIAILIAAFIIRSSGTRYKSIGTDRIFDVQTGEVKWADPPEPDAKVKK